MALAGAFNFILKLHRRPAILKRYGSVTTITAPIFITPANYFRNLEGPSETIIPGREFVIAKASIPEEWTGGPIERGDQIEDAEMGLMSITQVREVFDFGGSIMGYRVLIG